jgi:predicted 3-demethylubiquinone-9 3-methyltransferase (glyoxalase superfamily)
MKNGQKIIPNLWYDRQAEEAARLYASFFRNSRVGDIIRAGKAGFETHGIPEGTVMTVDFELEGRRFVAINGGPLFTFNPSISFLVVRKTPEEVDALWEKLSDGGTILMELDSYPFSQRFGWAKDRFGLSWQVMAVGNRQVRQPIVPSLLFAGEQCGNAEAAIRLYTGIFGDSKVGEIDRYGAGEEPERKGTVRRADFALEGQTFAAMDSGLDHRFAFNEAVSLMVLCETQAEIDCFWEKLTADGGQESMCGWLKDRFGVSWQVAPRVLREMLGSPDRAKTDRVTEAFLKMRKLDITALRRAFEGR